MSRMVLMVVKDLNNLLNLFRSRGYSVVEGTHAVLEDGSEVGTWSIRQGEEEVAEVLSHYVDTHYYELMKLPSSAGDSEIIDALMRAELRGIWRVPVEPVVLVLRRDELESVVDSYRDEYPSEEAREAAKHYLERYRREVIRELLRDVLKPQDRI